MTALLDPDKDALEAVEGSAGSRPARSPASPQAVAPGPGVRGRRRTREDPVRDPRPARRRPCIDTVAGHPARHDHRPDLRPAGGRHRADLPDQPHHQLRPRADRRVRIGVLRRRRGEVAHPVLGRVPDRADRGRGDRRGCRDRRRTTTAQRTAAHVHRRDAGRRPVPRHLRGHHQLHRVRGSVVSAAVVAAGLQRRRAARDAGLLGHVDPVAVVRSRDRVVPQAVAIRSRHPRGGREPGSGADVRHLRQSDVDTRLGHRRCVVGVHRDPHRTDAGLHQR